MRNLSILILLLITALSCTEETIKCPEGYGGNDCNMQLTPESIELTKIEVTAFPALDNSGSGWDIGGKADIYPYLNEVGAGTIWTSEVYYENVDPSGSYDFTLSEQLNPIKTYTIDLYDLDDTENEYMGSVAFNYTLHADNFPNPIIVAEGGIVLKLYVTYTHQ